MGLRRSLLAELSATQRSARQSLARQRGARPGRATAQRATRPALARRVHGRARGWRPSSTPAPSARRTAGWRRLVPVSAGVRRPAPRRFMAGQPAASKTAAYAAPGAISSTVSKDFVNASAVCCARTAGLTSTAWTPRRCLCSQAAIFAACLRPLGVSARFRSGKLSSASAWRQRIRSINATRTFFAARNAVQASGSTSRCARAVATAHPRTSPMASSKVPSGFSGGGRSCSHSRSTVAASFETAQERL